MSPSRDIVPSVSAAKTAASQAPEAASPSTSSVDRSLDVGNIVHLEHINLEVSDLEVARLFYGEGLGLTFDPSTHGSQRGGIGVVWYNIGRQQFHIAKGPENQTLPQGGAFFLVLPDVAKVAKQLETVANQLGDVSISHISPTMLEVTDPFGNRFVVQESVEGFPWHMGIANILLPCFPGTAKSITSFYSNVLGASVSLPSANRAEVSMGAGTKLSFVEASNLGAMNDEAVKRLHSGWHVALYISDFSGPFQKLMPQPVSFNNHPYRDKCHSFADAVENKQYRFQDIRADGGSGPLLYRLSHEVRSMYHPQCFKQLYNRA